MFKKLLQTSCFVICLGLSSCHIFAQSTNNVGSFLSSVTSYFSSFNTNLDNVFDSSKLSLWTTVDSMQNSASPLANSIGLSYILHKKVSVESLTRNSGVAGVLLNQQFGLGLNFHVHDVRLTIYNHGGYDFNRSNLPKFVDKIYDEAGIRVDKLLTPNTYATVGIGVQLPRGSQILSAGIGIIF